MCGGYLQEAGFCFHLSPYGEQAVVHVCALEGMGLGPGEWGKVRWRGGMERRNEEEEWRGGMERRKKIAENEEDEKLKEKKGEEVKNE